MKRLCSMLSIFLIFASLSAVLAKASETAKVIFTSRRDGNFEIYSMNPDGSDEINLTQHRARITRLFGRRQVNRSFSTRIETG